MAIDNQKISRLADRRGDVDTSELEVLSIDLIPTDEELEMDADTFSLESDAEIPADDATLQTDLTARDERISSLQFDIEQLRARWTGLEKEIEAREELTEMLQNDLKAAHKDLAARDRRIGKLDKKIERLKSTLSAAARNETVMAELEEEVGRLQAQGSADRERIDELQQALDRAQQDATEALEALHSQEYEENLSTAESTIASQAGEIAHQADHAKALKERLAASERYADELRSTIREISAERDVLAADVEALTATGRKAAERLNELEDQLDNTSQRLDETSREFEAERVTLETSVGELEAELDEARRLLDEKETSNTDLAAQLTGTVQELHELRQSSESTAGQHAAEIEKIRLHNEELQASLAAAEEKILNQDNAISALVSELAKKSRTIDSIDEIGHAIHEIDGRMSERLDEGHGQDRERPTRLLTGNIDGQELRFPLFKDRLTIGRTAQNDIQLRAQYISRRHAVMIIEDESARILDWGSKNGVYVNKARVSDQILKNGDVVAIGTAEFVFEERPRRETA